MLVDELNSEDARNRVEQRLADYLKNSSISMDAFDLTDKLEWSVNMRLEKIGFGLKPSPIFLQSFFGGDRFGG
jgi:hypothetical protein